MNHLEIARQGAVKLASLVGPDGRFQYKYDGLTNLSLRGYNVLRHSGCIWALHQIYGALGDKTLIEASMRAVHWLLRNRIQQVDDTRICVVQNGSAKLGGAALAIVALYDADYIPTQHRAALIRALAEYICSQNVGNGRFIHKIDARTGEPSMFRSDYYTGQSLLALVKAFKITEDFEYLRVAGSSIEALCASEYGVVQQNHWMMYALEELSHYLDDIALIRYAEKICQQIIDDDSYRHRGQSTPIACRTEALLSLCRMYDRGTPVRRELAQRAIYEAQVNLVLQANTRLGDGAFRAGGGSDHVRIDYLQHNVMTFSWFAEIWEKIPRRSSSGMEMATVRSAV